jgi:hypothetical protein
MHYVHRRTSVLREGSVNNPRRLKFDDLVIYLDNMSDANATLINSIRITDAIEGEVKVITAGTSVYDALVLLGEIEPELEDEDAEDEHSDDPWNENGPFHERSLEGYEYDSVLLLDLMKDIDGTIDGKEPDEWMDDTDYDLYIDIPMNVRRPDGMPFDRHDVGRLGQLDMWFSRHFKHLTRTAKFVGIAVMLDRPQVGDESVDSTWQFY